MTSPDYTYSIFEWKFIGTELPVPLLSFGYLYFGIKGFKLNNILVYFVRLVSE